MRWSITPDFAANKIRRAVTVDISWAGRLVESYEFSKSAQIVQSNLSATNSFIDSLPGAPEIINQNYLWRNIPAQLIRVWLQQFRLSENLKAADPANLLRFIDAQLVNQELTSWRVAIMSKRTTESRSVLMKGDFTLNIGHYLRNFDPENSNNQIYYIRRSHIISPRDEFIDLTDDENRRAMERTEALWKSKNKEGVPEYPNGEIVRNEIRRPQNPLLLVYFLDPSGANRPQDQQQLTEPIVGYAISFPASQFNATVSYAVHEQLISAFNVNDNLEELEDDED